MAIVLPNLVTCALTYAQYAQLAAGTLTLPTGIVIDSVLDNLDDATVQVRFTGSALGSWAQTQPIQGHIEVSPAGVVNVEGIGSSSSGSSSGSSSSGA